MKNDLVSNTSTRLPIVLCLDVSPSMSMNNRIENLNLALKIFVNELKKESKVLNSVEIAVVTFSTNIEENSDFEMLDFIENKVFTTVPKGGTNLSSAVITSIKKIEDRLVELDNSDIDNYLPFLVLLTDGDPDQTDNSSNLETAINLVLSHCEKNNESRLIAPYIIGVGEQVAEKTLNRFAEKFTGKAIIIDGDEQNQKELFKELFSLIANSVRNSLDGASDLKGLYEKIQKLAVTETTKIHKKRGIL